MSRACTECGALLAPKRPGVGGRPRKTCWEVVMAGKPNPWAPLIEMWAMGVLPIGPVDGEYLVYVPEART